MAHFLWLVLIEVVSAVCWVALTLLLGFTLLSSFRLLRWWL